MGNLLDPRASVVHADVNKDHAHGDQPASPYRRALCDLSTAVPDTWMDVQNAKVTCAGCEFRIDSVHAAALGEFDPEGLLSHDIVAIARMIYVEVQSSPHNVTRTMEIGDFAALLANALYPDDENRWLRFLQFALDGEAS